MSKVLVNIALSLDGYMAPEGMSNRMFEQGERSWRPYSSAVDDGPSATRLRYVRQ